MSMISSEAKAIDWRQYRCGHNFPIGECPYAQCAPRDAAKEILALVKKTAEVCALIEDGEVKVIALELSLGKIEEIARRMLKP